MTAGRAPGAVVGLALLVGTLPLVVDPAGWYVFVAARWVLLVAATVALVPVVALAVVRTRRRLPAAVAGWWLALAAVALGSALASGAARTSVFGTNDRHGGAAMWVVHGALFVAAAAIVRRRRDLRLITRGVAFGSIAVTLWVAAQRLGWSVPSGVAGRVRPGGPLGNADFLGAASALALLVTVGAAIDRAQSERWRLVHLVASLGAAFCLVVSGTRAAWLGVAVGLAVFAALAVRSTGASLRIAVAGVGIVAVGLVGLGLWAGVGERLATVTTGTAAGRVATWERTASVIGDRPVLGWGPEGFAAGFGPSVDATWERDYGRRLVPDRAHNGLLDVGATLGVVGLAVYGATLLATGRAVRRTLQVAPSATTIGVAAALVAYLVQQQFLFQLFDVDAVAWVLAGAVVGVGIVDAGADAPAPSRRRAVASRRAGLGSALALSAVLAAALLVTLRVGVDGVTADRAARRSVDATASVSWEAARRAVDADPQTLHGLVLADAALDGSGGGAQEAARRRLGALRAGTFDDGRLTLARSRLARSVGTTSLVEDSRSEVVALVDVDPFRSDAWAELGALDLALGDPGRAEESYRRAVTLAPDRTTWWVGLARAADRAGNRATARDAIGRVDPVRLDADGRALRQRLLAVVRVAGPDGTASGR